MTQDLIKRLRMGDKHGITEPIKENGK